MTELFNVRVDITTRATVDALKSVLSYATHFEEIDRNRYRVGLTVVAPFEVKAQCRASNYVESATQLKDLTDVRVVDTAVSGRAGGHVE